MGRRAIKTSRALFAPPAAAAPENLRRLRAEDVTWLAKAHLGRKSPSLKINRLD